jgi:hypothetical protein
MPTARTAPLPPALALKKRAMALDAEMIRRLRSVRRLSYGLVHEFRLTAKRQRAWWRLARPMAGKTTARNANNRLADAAPAAGARAGRLRHAAHAGPAGPRGRSR